MQLTKHFSLYEMVRSETALAKGINNNPPEHLMPSVKRTAEGLELIRELIGRPLHVTSGYRCEALNKEVGGEEDSQHVKGEAADIVAPFFGGVSYLARFIMQNQMIIGFDQLIDEGNWVHVSFSDKPRGEVLTRTKSGYVAGLV